MAEYEMETDTIVNVSITKGNVRYTLASLCIFVQLMFLLIAIWQFICIMSYTEE